MRTHLQALAFFLLVGCTAPPARYAGVEPGVRRAERIKTIRITSVPTGCIVELNGEYIGQTPFSLTVDADANGCWPRRHPDGSMRTLINRFVCTAPTGISDSRSWADGDRIPDMVLFRPCGRYPGQQPLQLELSIGC